MTTATAVPDSAPDAMAALSRVPRSRYTPSQRQAAIDLVTRLREADPRRSHGAIAAASRQLTIPAAVLGRWLQQRDMAALAAGGPPPPDPRDQASRPPLIGLIGCARCGHDMFYRRAPVTGVAFLCCLPGCSRRHGLPVAGLERVVGQMLLRHLRSWAVPGRTPTTVEGVLREASRLIVRITAGDRVDDLRVRWRATPCPPATPAPPSAAGGSPSRPRGPVRVTDSGQQRGKL